MRNPKETTKPLQIGGKYKLESDEYNITLFEKKTITGTGRGRSTKKAVGSEYWTSLAYFSTPINAIHYLVDREIMIAGMKDYDTIIAKIQELHELIDSIKLA